MTDAPVRILIVDDSPEDREVYRRLLVQDREHRYEFLEAEFGEEGLRIALEEDPDCLLLDYRLPDVDGLEFLSRLPAEKLVPVIVLTGQGNEAVAVEAMKSGAQDYLLKGSVTRDRLQHAVRNAIEKVALRRKVEERTAELARGQRGAAQDVRRAGGAGGAAHGRAVGRQPGAQAGDPRPRVGGAGAGAAAGAASRRRAGRPRRRTASRTSSSPPSPTSCARRSTPSSAGRSCSRTGKLDAGRRQRGRSTTIERNARAQAQLIDDLLDVSRIITGKLRLELRAGRPRRRSSTPRSTPSRPAADAKDIRARVALDAAAGAPCCGDPDRLQQVVWNLLSNAIKFTPRGRPRARSRCGATDGAVELAVDATRAWASAPDFLPYVFDRFRQADSRRPARHGGLGLGLAIVRHLVELHGGTCRCAERGRGPGRHLHRQPAAARAELADGPRRPRAVGAGSSRGGRADLLDGRPRAGRRRRGRHARPAGDGARAVRRARCAAVASAPEALAELRALRCPTCWSPTSACRTRTATR